MTSQECDDTPGTDHDVGYKKRTGFRSFVAISCWRQDKLIGVRVLPMEGAVDVALRGAGSPAERWPGIAGRSARLLRIENGKSARPFSLF